ncbi:MAG TPA: iron-containing redox enzyme family protein [Propionibacteriaceae bacterium]|nr:iron-containing redox enzyme family protein [Propionibacteriaceae bacterium]
MTELRLSTAFARGPLSQALIARLLDPADAAPELIGLAAKAARSAAGTTLTDEDVQLSLTLLYELHYRGIAGVDGRWEWHPDMVAASAELEAAFEADLHGLADTRLPDDQVAPQDLPAALTALIQADDGPSLARYVARQASVDEVLELLTHRSIYHLKEADAHSWAIPRLAGAPKSALVEIQADEYGGGDPSRMHSALFAQTMCRLGLDDSYGGYLDRLPAVTLAWMNAMTFFGLHRRLRGAVVGHLAVVEMDSSLPSRLYGNGLRRLGFDAVATAFFDEHVEADAVHEQIAAHDLAGQLARQEPALIPDMLFGAAVALATNQLVAMHLTEAWRSGRSSLRSQR